MLAARHKAIGKRKIAPTISPNKTWEGFVGGTLSAALIGALLWRATPFTNLAGRADVALDYPAGLCGWPDDVGRDRGVKDYGGALAGHGGFLDRIDSICFAAPVFFHATRYFFT